MIRRILATTAATGLALAAAIAGASTASAVWCNDGTWSNSSGRGTCSWHGGIDRGSSGYGSSGSNSWGNSYGNSYKKPNRGNSYGNNGLNSYNNGLNSNRYGSSDSFGNSYGNSFGNSYGNSWDDDPYGW